MHKKLGGLLAGAVLALVTCGQAQADVIVSPNANATTEGDGNNLAPFDLTSAGLATMRYQQVYGASDFASLSGPQLITQIAFRPDIEFGSAFSRTLPDIQINLSTTTFAPDALSSTFATNVGVDDTVVYNRGALSLSSSATGGPPRNLDILINLTTPFLYNPTAGNLLLDVRNYGGGRSTVFDSQNTTGDSLSRVYNTDVNSPTATRVDSIGLVTQFTTVAAPTPTPTPTPDPNESDKTAPVTEITIEGTQHNGFYTSAVTILLDATDDASGVEATFYSIDNGTTQIYDPLNPPTVDASGEHDIEYWSIDNYGNEEAHRVLQFTIDVVAPSVAWGQPVPAANVQGWNNTAVTLPYTPQDLNSGIESAVPNPVHFGSEGADQTQTITLTDRAGNVSVFTSAAVSIDMTAPQTVSQISGTMGNNGWFRSPVTVSLDATDALSGIASTLYALNGGASTSYSTPIGIGEGVHDLSYKSVDLAGNVYEKQTTIKVDATAPALTLSASPLKVAPLKKSAPFTVTLTGRLADGLSGAAATSAYSVVDEYGQAQPSGNFAVAADGSFLVTVQLINGLEAKDVDGRFYRLTVTASDKAGNAVSQTATVVVAKEERQPGKKN